MNHGTTPTVEASMQPDDIRFTFRRCGDSADQSYDVFAFGVRLGEVYYDPDADPRARWFITGARWQESVVYNRRRRYGCFTRASAALELAVMNSARILAALPCAEAA